MAKLSYYVFGAHSRGQTTRIYLKILYPEWTFLGYLYANDEKNPDSIDGEEVNFLPEKSGLNLDARVYIGTRGVYHGQVRKLLEDYGFKDIMPVDMELDIELRNKFIPGYFRARGRSFIRLEELISCDSRGNGRSEKGNHSGVIVGTEIPTDNTKIYVVRSAVDAPLTDDVPLQSYEAFIQAGRAIAGKAIDDCDFFDNTGENISERNRQMCELTAMYWIWKNSDSDIVGLEHYRRRFILSEDWESVFVDDKADVILPVPLFVNPSLRGNYYLRHDENAWNAMMDAMYSVHPECAEEAKAFFENTGCYSPCNMLITRKDVFDKLCEWLFPILFATMDNSGTLNDSYQNRYPGFLSERLISFYFFYREKELKVVYADKTFLGA